MKMKGLYSNKGKLRFTRLTLSEQRAALYEMFKVMRVVDPEAVNLGDCTACLGGHITKDYALQTLFNFDVDREGSTFVRDTGYAPKYFDWDKVSEEDEDRDEDWISLADIVDNKGLSMFLFGALSEFEAKLVDGECRVRFTQPDGSSKKRTVKLSERDVALLRILTVADLVEHRTVKASLKAYLGHLKNNAGRLMIMANLEYTLLD